MVLLLSPYNKVIGQQSPVHLSICIAPSHSLGTVGEPQATSCISHHTSDHLPYVTPTHPTSHPLTPPHTHSSHITPTHPTSHPPIPHHTHSPHITPTYPTSHPLMCIVHRCTHMLDVNPHATPTYMLPLMNTPIHRCPRSILIPQSRRIGTHQRN